MPHRTRHAHTIVRVVGVQYCVASSGLAIIIVEQSAKAFSPDHMTRMTTHGLLPYEELVVETLMIALGMIMSQILVDHIMERSFAKHEYAIEGFLLDRAHEPFAVGVQIRTAGRQADRFHPTILEQGIKRLRELRVPVVDQIALAQEEPIKWIGQLAHTVA